MLLLKITTSVFGVEFEAFGFHPFSDFCQAGGELVSCDGSLV